MVCSSCIASSEDDLIANDKRQRMKLHPLNIKERASEQTPSGHVLLWWEYLKEFTYDGNDISSVLRLNTGRNCSKTCCPVKKNPIDAGFSQSFLFCHVGFQGRVAHLAGSWEAASEEMVRVRGNGESETPFSLYHFLFPFSFSSFCKLCQFLSRNLKIRHLSQRAG